MVIKVVVVEDSTILVLILGLIMVNLLAILILGTIMVISLGMPLILLSFLEVNLILKPRMVLVLTQVNFKCRIFLIQGLPVRFVARMVTLPWIAIIA